MSVGGAGTWPRPVPLVTPCCTALRHPKVPGTQEMFKVLGSEHSIFKGGLVVVFNLKHYLPLPPDHFLLLSAHILLFWKKSSKYIYQ